MTNREFYAQQVRDEQRMFVAVLEALPEAELAYRPHPKSRSARELVGHLIAEAQGLTELAESGESDYQDMVPFEMLEAGVAAFSESCAQLVERVQALDDGVWQEGTGKLHVGRTLEMPTFKMMWWLFHDMIHHRGQLSTYIRPMGGKVPPIYGPSADS